MTTVRILLVPAIVLLLAALAPGAAACTVQPIPVCTVDDAPVQVCAWGPCPPATNGGAYVRVGDRTYWLEWPL